MFENAFIDRTTPPSDAELAHTLGSAATVWNALLAQFTEARIATGHEWKCHSPRWGWSLRVVNRKRTIVWLSPGRGGFNALFILGQAAVEAARTTPLPAAVATALAAAPKYPEGTGLRLPVRSARHLPALRKLAAIKAAR